MRRVIASICVSLFLATLLTGPAHAGPPAGKGPSGGGGGTTEFNITILDGDAYGCSNADDIGDVVVVGEVETATGFHASSWLIDGNGQIVRSLDLGTLPGGTESYAISVNDYGELVGNGATDGFRAPHAFVYLPSLPNRGLIDLGTLGGLFSTAKDINNSRQIVGDAKLNDGSSEGAFWEIDANGDVTRMVSLGDFFPYAINNLGVMAGEQQGEAAIAWFDSGSLQVIRVGGRRAYGINDNGAAVGFSSDSDGTSRAFIWTQEDGLQPLGDGQTYGSFANAVNNQGTVCGDVENSMWQAVYWENGQMVDLNKVTDTKFHLIGAGGINDDRWLVGTARHRKLGDVGFVAIPTSP